MRKLIDDFNNFSNKQIKDITNIEYLKELEKNIDNDINNINKDSDVISKMKAKMRNISVEEMKQQQLDELINMKRNINNRISELI